MISIALLFCAAFSPAFYELYIAGGISDMIDGAVARKTGTVSGFGSRLDTIADIVFAAACLIRLLPVLDVPVRIYIWIAVIACMKLANIVAGYISRKELAAVHSVMNKVTGCLLFIFPLSLTLIDLKYSAPLICAIASIAAVYEGYMIQAGRTA